MGLSAHAPPSAAEPPSNALPPAAIPAAHQAILQLRVAVSQSMLYAIGTKQFDKVCETTLAALQNILQCLNSFQVSITRGDAIINGIRIDSPTAVKGANEFLEKAFNAAGVSSLRFESGVTNAEVGPFLQRLAHKNFGSSDGAKINQDLRAEGIVHIQVGELRYVAVGDKQKVVSANGSGGGALSFGNLEDSVHDAVNALDAAVHGVDDATAGKQLRADFAQELLEKDDDMIGEIVDMVSQRLRSSGRADLLERMALPQRDAQLFAEMAGTARDLTQRGVAHEDPLWAHLHQMAGCLLRAYQQRPDDILPLLEVDAEAAALLPDWLLQVHQAMQGTAAQRARGFLTYQPAHLLDEKLFAQVFATLRELLAAPDAALAGALADHLCAGLQTACRNERLAAAKQLAALADACGAALIEERVVAAFKAACMHETCPAALQAFVEFFQNRCYAGYLHGAESQTLAHLQWLCELREHPPKAPGETAPRLAQQALSTLAHSEFAELARQKFVGDGAGGETAAAILKCLGKDTYATLIDYIIGAGDDAQATRLLQRLSELGPEASALYYKRLESETDPARVLRLFDIALAAGGSAALLDVLPALLLHADNGIREKALGALQQLQGGQAITLLAQALQDELELPRRKPLLAHLAQRREQAAALTLLDEVGRAFGANNEEYAVMVLEALAPVAPAEVIPLLNQHVFARGRGVLGGKPGSKQLTWFALKNLARHYKLPAAIDILERYKQDKDPEIARFALVLLRGLLSAECRPLGESQIIPIITPAPSVVAPATSTDTGCHGSAAVSRPVPLCNPGIAGAGQPPAADPRHSTSPAPRITRTLHRNFEDSDAIPRPKTTAVVPPPPVLAAPPALNLRNLRPTQQGKLQEMNFMRLLWTLAARSGMLLITSSDGEGRVFIHEHSVLAASYRTLKEVAALSAMETLKIGTYAFYAGVSGEVACKIPINTVQAKIVAYRDQADENRYF